jgi:hypothetical protein
MFLQCAEAQRHVSVVACFTDTIALALLVQKYEHFLEELAWVRDVEDVSVVAQQMPNMPLVVAQKHARGMFRY